MRIRGHLSAVTLSLAIFSYPASIWAADLVVVDARGVGLRPGQVLDSAKPIVLTQGQHVTLISITGATFKLDGPYNKAPNAQENQGVDLSDKLAALVTQRQIRVEVGTARGIQVSQLPDPWLLDLSRAGNVCLLEGSTPVFWRADARPESTLQVMPADRSWKVEARWQAGADRISMAANVPIHAGAAYITSVDGAQAALTLVTVPKMLANDSMRAAWMAEKGCEEQAEALLRTGK